MNLFGRVNLTPRVPRVALTGPEAVLFLLKNTTGVQVINYFDYVSNKLETLIDEHHPETKGLRPFAKFNQHNDEFVTTIQEPVDFLLTEGPITRATRVAILVIHHLPSIQKNKPGDVVDPCLNLCLELNLAAECIESIFEGDCEILPFGAALDEEGKERKLN